MLGLTRFDSEAATLEIVWRNPDRVRSHRRRHSFEATGERALYILQEFVAGHWMKISDLEIVVGGRAA